MWGTTESDSPTDLAIDSNNFLYVLGTTSGSFDGHTERTGADIFVTKWSSPGVKLWTRQFYSTGIKSDDPAGIAIDSNNFIYIGGSTYGDLGGPLIGGKDIIVLKLHTNGTIVDIKKWGGAAVGYLEANGFALRSDAGSGYVVGALRGTMYGVGDTETDAYMLKYNLGETSSCLTGKGNGAFGCLDCNPGTFSSTTDNSPCYTCLAGRFSNISKSTTCQNCTLSGTVCLAGSANPTSCPQGSYCPTFMLPVLCPIGSFCPNTSMIAPQVCPRGSYCPVPVGHFSFHAHTQTLTHSLTLCLILCFG